MIYRHKKKLIGLFFVLTIFLSFFAKANYANATCTAGADGNTKYCLLAPIPGLTKSSDGSIDVTTGFGDYANKIIRIFIGILGVIAVAQVVFGGIQYMISESGGEKNAGKERITNAIFGLILALSTYMILNTLNPKLVNLGISVPPAGITSNKEGALVQDGKDVGTPTPAGFFGNKVINASSQTQMACDNGTLAFSNLLYNMTFTGSLEYPLSKDENKIFSPTLHNQKMSIKLIGNAVFASSLYNVFAKWRDDKDAIRSADASNPDGHFQITRFDGTDDKCIKSEGDNVLQSPHTFGLAIDIGPADKIPQKLIDDFKSEGWGWGGDWPKKNKGHFSKLVTEGGSGSGSFWFAHQ